MKHSRKFYLKLFLVTFLSIIVLVFAANIYAGIYLRKYFEQHIARNDSIPYRIEIAKLSANLFTGSVCATSVVIRSKDSVAAGGKNQLNLEAAGIKISGMSYTKLFFNKSLHIRKFMLERPVLRITNFNNEPKAKDSAGTANLYNLIEHQFTVFHLNSLEIEKGNIHITSRDSADFLVSIPEFNLEITEINADSTLNESGRRFDAGEMKIGVTGTKGHFMKGLYAFSLPSLQLSGNKGLLTIDTLQLYPAVEKKEFAAALGYQTDCIDLMLTDLKVHAQHFTQLLEMGTFLSEKIEIGELILTDYRDQNFPRPSGIKPMPQELLNSLPIQLSIDQLILTKATITYEELAEGKSESGAISFSNTTGEILNISNMKPDDTMKIIASGYMINQAAVSSQLMFPLNGNTFSASVNMGAFDMRILNPMVRNLAPIEIVDGKAVSMQMWCAADEISGSGQMTFVYADLQVSVLEKKKNKEQSIVSGMKNFIANEIILEKNNPKDDMLRVGKVSFARNPERNIINYSWNLIFSGFKSSIGLTDEKLSKAI